MRISAENQIRIIAMLVYSLIVLLLAGSLRYIYNLHRNVKDQRLTTAQYDHKIRKAESLILSVNELQANMNLSLKEPYFHSDSIYHKEIMEVRGYIDSLRIYGINEESQSVLQEVEQLLHEKNSVVMKLQQTLKHKDLLKDVNKYVNNYRKKQLNDLVYQATRHTQTDSVITRAGEKKGFFKRLTSLFSGKEAQDTIKISSSTQEDTTTSKQMADSKADSLRVGISKFIQQAGKDYISQLSSIESQINNLVSTDQHISARISHLLMTYYLQILDLRIKEVDKSETLVSRYNRFIVIGSVLSLLLISLAMFSIVRNVKMAKQRRLELEKANQRITQVMESRHQLLLSVSHDIKTPLNSIMGTLQLHHDSSTQLPADNIPSMLSSGDHILALLNNLLGYSAIQQEKLILQTAPFRLQDCCQQIVNIFNPLCNQKHLELHTNFLFPPELIVKTDQLKLKQIIINILSNAVKYTKFGYVALTIEYSNNVLSIKIEDSGVGISAEKKKTIFKPFVRVTENQAMAEGMGVGLYVVKGLVELFGGSIDVKSKVNEGTTFLLTIPAEEDTTMVHTKAPSTKAKKVLLIDDDISLLKTLGTTIKQSGHTAIICQDIQTLKTTLLQEKTIDLIITDMEMGQFSGIDVLELAQKHHPDTPVVLMTARYSISTESVTRMGFSACLIKPISISTLLMMIEQQQTPSLETVHDRTIHSENFKSLETMLNHDYTAIKKVLELFQKQIQIDLEQLEKLFETNDNQALRNKCHKMLSSLLQIAPKSKICNTLRTIDQMSVSQISQLDKQQEITIIKQHTEDLLTQTQQYISEFK